MVRDILSCVCNHSEHGLIYLIISCLTHGQLGSLCLTFQTYEDFLVILWLICHLITLLSEKKFCVISVFWDLYRFTLWPSIQLVSLNIVCAIKECVLFGTMCRLYVHPCALACNYVAHIFSVHTGMFVFLFYNLLRGLTFNLLIWLWICLLLLVILCLLDCLVFGNGVTSTAT